MSLRAGTRVGPYEIIALLGAGGMGEVFRARDTRLERDVAIKVLPERLAKDAEALTRFAREAKAVAALSHPHILAIHDVGTEQGVSFVVMELLEGETLRERVRRSAIPWRQAAEYGVAIADGLAAAHAKGIIHRDLKPENIFLTKDGLVKILDFGLARVGPAAGGTPPEDQAGTPTMTLDTRPGTVLGTVNYMSPEQISGRATDARTDIFSFGCVLHEMVSGRKTFAGESIAEITTAVLRDEPAPLADSGHAVPVELDREITRCLEKKPEQRIQSARDLAFTLRDILSDSGSSVPRVAIARPRGRAVFVVQLLVGVLAAAALLVALNVGGWRQRLFSRPQATGITSLAVLPLENLSGDQNQEYFADGMTGELITALGKIRALTVISRMSVMAYKNTDKSPAEIARELNVDALVEGTVTRSGDRVRIAANLIKADTSAQLWGESYERDLRDVLALQSEIARAIAEEIKITVTPRERARLATAHVVNPRAHEAYLKGRHLWNQRTESATRKAIEHFEAAIEQDPSFALAHAALAEAYVVLAGHRYMRPSAALPQAKLEAERAIALDETLGAPHAVLAVCRSGYDWDLPGAEDEFKTALELSPGHATGHQWYAEYLGTLGRVGEALEQVEKARALDPASRIVDTSTVLILYRAHLYDQAIEHGLKVLDFDPNFAFAHFVLGCAYAKKGLHEKAIVELQEAIEFGGRSTEFVSALGHVYAAAGMTAEARELLGELHERAETEHVSSYGIATVYAGLGDTDEAFRWLGKAYDERSLDLGWIVRVDPMLDSLHGDSRFDALLRRIVPAEAPAIETTAAARPSNARIMLAVLPFEDHSGDPDARYLADEIPASIIDTLTTLSELHVVPRSTAFRHRNRDEDIVSIARRLQANFALTGQIVTRGNQLRIRAELVDIATQSQRWGGRYDRSLDNTATVEEDITERIVEALRVHVTGEEQTRLRRRRPIDDGAHSAYLEGRFWWNKRTEQGLQKAIELFDKAISVDPGYALAYAGKADSYCSLGWAYRRPQDTFPQARQAVEQALALDPELAEAYPALGWVRMAYDWDWPGTERAFQKALQLNPRYPNTHHQYSAYLLATGRLDDALREARRAQELDPGSLIINMAVGATLYVRRDYAAAAAQLTRTLEMGANFAPAHQMLGLVYLRMKRYNDAIGVYRWLHDHGGRVPANAGQLGLAYAVAGRRAEALEELRILEDVAKKRYMPPTAFALIHAGLGDMDEAFRWMDRAFDERDRFLTLLKVSPTFDELRGDPRFNDLVRRIGLEPDEKSQSAAEPPGGKPGDDRIRLVVLPFANISADPEQEYFSDGMTEEIIAQLGRLQPKKLAVIARTTAMQYKDTKKQIDRIGRELNVDYIIDGSVRRAGDRVRITAQLSQVSDQAQLWSDIFERELTDVFALQADVAERVARSLALELLPDQKARLARDRPVNPAAYDWYLLGRHHFNKWSPEHVKKAIEHFQQAIELDPAYAAAYAGLADCYAVSGFFGYLRPKEAYSKQMPAVMKALELDDSLGEAHVSLGAARLYHDWDWVGAERSYKRAIELDPSFAWARQLYAWYLGMMGRFDEAIAEANRARKLDPLSVTANLALGYLFYDARQYDRAVEQVRETLELDANDPRPRLLLAQAYQQKGMYDEAVTELEQVVTLSEGQSLYVAALGQAYAGAGKTDAARKILAELIEESKQAYVPPHQIALLYASLGQEDQAFQWLEKAYEERDAGLVWLKVSPEFDPLRSDPRFNDLLRRIGLQP